MKKITSLLLALGWLLSLASFGQKIEYNTYLKPDNTKVHFKDSAPNYGAFDVRIPGNLPANAVQTKKGSRPRVPYTPEGKASYNWSQFGVGKYYSSKFGFCLDEGGYMSINERRSYGINLFNFFTIKADYSAYLGPGKGVIDWRSQLRKGEGMFYATQNILGSEYEKNTVFFVKPLPEFFDNAWSSIPTIGQGDFQNYRYWVWNLETCVFGINPGQKGSTYAPGFGAGDFENWAVEKNYSFKMESTGEVVTLEGLANKGPSWWEIEMHTRRAARMALVCEIVRKKADPSIDVKVSIGYSPYVFYMPATSAVNSSDSFFSGSSNLTNIGGDSQGNITFQNVPGVGNWTVNLKGDGLDHSDFIQGYHYELFPWYYYKESQTYHDIFVARTSGFTTQAQIWATIPPDHYVAIEKGWTQINRKVVFNRTGKWLPVMFQKEKIYESSEYFLPFSDVQNIIRFGNPQLRDTPRLEIPHIQHYSSYCVARFMGGDEAGWGWYLFPVDQLGCVQPLNATDPIEGKIFYNYDAHTVSGVMQARADMQIFENYYPGSVLVEDPEVRVNQTGNWSAYSGTDALAYNGGVFGTPRPSYMLRWKAVPGGWQVLILGGMKQGWTEECTDLIRVPGGGVAGNVFKTKLRGPGAHVFSFFVPSSASGQTFEAVHTAYPSREKAGYAGWIKTN